MRYHSVRWILLGILIFSSVDALAGSSLQVGVKSGPLRASPAPFGKILATLGYGDRVEALEVSGAWQRVRHGKVEGWMHGTLLSSRVTELSAGEGTVSTLASSDDLTLAGKGFNSQVESAYRKRHAALNYAAIDRMEQQVVTPKQMLGFFAEGGIIPEGGVQ